MIGLEYKNSIELNCTPDSVWNALTEPGAIAKYFLAPIKVLELREGGKIIYGTSKDELIYGQILIVENAKRLRHTFRFAGSFHEGTKNNSETLVDYTIQRTQIGSLLTLTHSGFKESNQTYANISGGWPIILNDLKTYLEKMGGNGRPD